MIARRGAWTRAESSPWSIGRRGRILASLAAAALAVASVAGGAGAQVRRSGAAAGATSEGSPLTPFAARKAERLLRDQLPCLGCHTLGNEGGKIGPDLTTVRTRRSAAYVAAMVADPQATAPAAAMPKVAMPEATRLLVVRYLSSQPGSAGGPVSLATTSRPPSGDGAALYARWCAACHGAGGKGDGPNAPFLPVKAAAHADTKVMALRPDDSLYDTIAGGGAIMNRSPRMPPFGATLSAGEIRALVAHIRTLCRCEGPEWSRDGSPARGER